MNPTANPMGCHLCGIDRDIHARQVGANGSHVWQRPTLPQIKARMLARRAARRGNTRP